MLYRVISCHLISYHVAYQSYHIIPYRITSIIPYYVISRHLISYHVAYQIKSYHVISQYQIVACILYMLRFDIYYDTSYRIIVYIKSYRTVSYLILLYRIPSHRIPIYTHETLSAIKSPRIVWIYRYGWINCMDLQVFLGILLQ